MVENICRELTVAWQPVGLSFSFERRQMQTQVARIISLTEKTLCLSFEIRMPHGSGLLNLAFPAVVANTILRRLTTDWSRRRRHAGETRARMADVARRIRFGCSLQLPTARVAASALEHLQPGDVLRLGSRRRHAFRVEGGRPPALGCPGHAPRLAPRRAHRARDGRRREMKTYFDCWAEVAAALFSQALAGEPELAESLPKPLGAGSFGLAATMTGDTEGRFAVLVDGSVLETPLVGEGMDQKAGWMELLREAADAAAGELLAKTGKKCQVVKCEEIAGESQVSRAFQLRSGQRAWTILVRDEVRMPDAEPDGKIAATAAAKAADPQPSASMPPAPSPAANSGLTPGLELLLDVELEASLRFGAREMPLGEILDLGPGDVVELDRHVADPVDLIVGDKIVARGEVVLVNGNFGLRVTEVAAPRKRLESIRCLF